MALASCSSAGAMMARHSSIRLLVSSTPARILSITVSILIVMGDYLSRALALVYRCYIAPR